MVERVRIINCPDCGKNARESRTVINGELKKTELRCPYCNHFERV